MKFLFFILSLLLTTLPCLAKTPKFKPLYQQTLNKKSLKFLKYTNNQKLPKENYKIPTPKVLEEPNPWLSYLPEIPSHLNKDIEDIQKERNTIAFKSQTYESQVNPEESKKLTKIREEILRHYLEKQIIQRKIIDKAKESSSVVRSVNDSVEAVSGKANLQVQASDNFKMGTKTDILRQKSELWIDSSWFKSEAKLLYPNFQEASYLVSLSRSFDFSDMEYIPFSKISSSVAFDGVSEDVTSTLKTQLMQNLEFTYQNLLKNKQDSVSVNYQISF